MIKLKHFFKILSGTMALFALLSLSACGASRLDPHCKMLMRVYTRRRTSTSKNERCHVAVKHGNGFCFLPTRTLAWTLDRRKDSARTPVLETSA